MNQDKELVYMQMAHQVKALSPDKETKVGAIMLSSEGRIVASSYNGFLRGAIDEDLPKTRPNKYEFIQHAETNIIYNCGYEGIRTKDTKIVCTLSPCLFCLRACYQSGVTTIIYDELYHNFDNDEFYSKLPDVHVSVSKTKNGFTRLDLQSKKDNVEFKNSIEKLKQEFAKINSEEE